MKIFDRFCLKAFLYGVPLVVLFALVTFAFRKWVGGNPDGLLGAFYNLGGLALAFWVLIVFCLSVRMLFCERLRDAVLTRLAFMKERDEREVQLTGRATRVTFLMTLSLLLFLLFLSCFQISIYRVPQEYADENGKTGRITMGLYAELFNKEAPVYEDSVPHSRDIFVYTKLPISTTTVILLLIFWNIGLYGFFMRRMLSAG